MLRSLITALLVLASTAPVVAQAVTFRARLDRPDITVGESARLELVLSWQGTQDAHSIEQWNAPEVRGAPLVAESDDFRLEMQGGQPTSLRRVVYPVRGEEEGQLGIGPARVTLKGADGTRQYATLSTGVHVRAAPAPFPVRDVALGLLGIGLVAVAVRATRRMRMHAPGPPPPSRADRLRARCEELRQTGRRDHREFFESCLDELRSGLEREHGLVVKERDRDRAIAALERAGVDATRRAAADELMKLCDEARFNPEPPADATRERALVLLTTVLSD